MTEPRPHQPSAPPASDTAGRARSFGAVADAYHRHRPGYPDAALDWALAPVADRAELSVLDLAAGTGKLTESLVGRATTVTAVEPDEDMLAVLRAALPAVTALAGTAEAIPLPAASVDAVLVGQAFHWFDTAAAVAEIARVLRPGGALGLLWNYEDRKVEWVVGYYDAAGFTERSRHRDRKRPDLGPLAPGEHTRFDNSVPATTDSMLDTLRTYSWISTLTPAERDARLSAARAYLAGRPETAGGRFELPLRTDVVRAVRARP